jgi:hypothetical protein
LERGLDIKSDPEVANRLAGFCLVHAKELYGRMEYLASREAILKFKKHAAKKDLDSSGLIFTKTERENRSDPLEAVKMLH